MATFICKVKLCEKEFQTRNDKSFLVGLDIRYKII